MSGNRNEEIVAETQHTPPSIPQPYDPKNALADLPGTVHTLELFLSSKMHESEKFCDEADPEKQRLYFASAYGIIQSFKGLMSFADEDLLTGLTHAKRGNTVAAEHRKPAASITSRLAGLVFASSSQLAYIASMTDVERHAELVYAESLFEKALLSIMYSGDWLAFIKEALNLRTTISIYRSLYAYIQSVDGDDATYPYPKNSIDPHFRTGVYLGMGASHLVLSLLPSRILGIVEMFGYKGDRHLGLELLAKAGGWTSDKDEPAVSAKEEGLRRTICDMALMMFHLFISGFTFDGVDINMAARILHWNLKRYPNGVFFLLGAGRLAVMQSQPAKAVVFYQKAIDVQDQYRNLHHMSYWEMAGAYLSLWDIGSSLKCWRIMAEEASWSKAVYTYATATCLLELGGAANIAEARKLLEKVPGLRQRIAGKSIPLEKFVARKARKHLDLKPDQPATLPALELAYTFLGIAHAPQEIISENMIPVVNKTLSRLGVEPIHKPQADPKNGITKTRPHYWDDLCLARMLEGVCWRYMAFPDPDAVRSPEPSPSNSQVALPTNPVSQADASSCALEAFKEVLKYGPKIELDHHLVYHTHYELGRLLACRGDTASAKEHFDLVMSGKPLEVNAAGKKGKYSLENALIVRTSAALDALKSQRL